MHPFEAMEELLEDEKPGVKRGSLLQVSLQLFQPGVLLEFPFVLRASHGFSWLF